jgi:hypothetical protein
LGIFGARKPRASLRFALGYHRSPFQGCGEKWGQSQVMTHWGVGHGLAHGEEVEV